MADHNQYVTLGVAEELFKGMNPHYQLIFRGIPRIRMGVVQNCLEICPQTEIGVHRSLNFSEKSPRPFCCTVASTTRVKK